MTFAYQGRGLANARSAGGRPVAARAGREPRPRPSRAAAPSSQGPDEGRVSARERLAEELGDPVELVVERFPAHELVSGGNDGAPQLRLEPESLERLHGASWIVRTNEQPGAALGERRPDSPDVGGYDRQAGRLGLEEHLGQAFRVRDVKERVAAAVLLPEARPRRHVAEQLPGVLEPALPAAG